MRENAHNTSISEGREEGQHPIPWAGYKSTSIFHQFRLGRYLFCPRIDLSRNIL